jgi:hypothetical protein
MTHSFKITFVLSLFWHILCIGIFEPTFGHKLNKLNFTQVSFLGSILKPSDLYFGSNSKEPSHSRRIFIRRIINQMNSKPLTLNEKKDIEYFSSMMRQQNRPLFSVFIDSQKPVFTVKPDTSILEGYKKESTLLFHPRLPYSFLIYFRDRQRAHIEFTFYISDKGKLSFIKRRISSGNLEADLLAYRYISRCMYLVQNQFPLNSWQTVKIDLIPKDGQD